MHEYVAQAVILDREPLRDFDSRVSFFTEKFGKLVGKAVSTRKITSKLAGHLEPGNFVHLRFVEKKGLQVVDGIKSGRLKASPPDLYFLDKLLPEGEADPELWQLLKSNRFSWPQALAILGWDPAAARCSSCGARAKAFYVLSHEMFCTACASKLPPSQVLYW